MKKSIIFLLFASLCIFNVDAQKKIPHTYRPMGVQPSHRTEIILPQVNGYNVYKGDFHIHTSYSDGRVNPKGRVTEAWHDGLDVIAITDHYEGTSGLKGALKVAAPQSADGKAMGYKGAKELGVAPADFNAELPSIELLPASIANENTTLFYDITDFDLSKSGTYRLVTYYSRSEELNHPVALIVEFRHSKN